MVTAYPRKLERSTYEPFSPQDKNDFAASQACKLLAIAICSASPVVIAINLSSYARDFGGLLVQITCYILVQEVE